MTNKMRLIHPGEILKDELAALNLSANAFAKALGVPANRVTGILNERRAITADTALRLARFFGTTPEFWMNLQASYEVNKAREEVGKEIVRTVKPGAKLAA
ncbi:MAG: HigA family addiction module antidote protein [Betaproteobacteria bacterium]|nr:HigA family addiction module antidote protein [Betaproteobacteria bacterium]